MKTKADAQIIADSINAECRKMVIPFVMARTDLTPEQFEAEAEAYLADVEQRMRHRLGAEIDDTDELMIEGYRRAMRFEYKRLRSAGASAAGKA